MIKVLFESGSFDTDVKLKQKATVSGVPVIVTTNTEIWRFALEAAAPIEERIYRWHFPRTINFKIPGPIHPKVWLEIVQAYNFEQEMKEESSSGEEGYGIENF